MNKIIPHKNWQTYWADIGPRLSAYIIKAQKILLLQYLENSFALYSFTIEDFESKIKAHTDLCSKLSIFLIETQDLMRGVIACYRDLTLAPLGLILRTAFEIHCNLKYIVRSNTPEKYADLYDRFQEIEQLLGVKASASFPDPTEADFQKIATHNPEWFQPGTIKLVDKTPHWTAIKGMNLFKVADSSHVALTDDYKGIYKTQSKFTHASPIIRNLYRKSDGLRAIPNPKQAEELAMLAQGYCIKTLEEACNFFQVEFPEYENALIGQDLLEAMGLPRMNPADFE